MHPEIAGAFEAALSGLPLASHAWRDAPVLRAARVDERAADWTSSGLPPTA